MAKDAALEYRQLLSSAFSSTRVLAALVRHDPHYDTVSRLFHVTAPSLMEPAPAYAIRVLELLPAGVVRLVHPVQGNEAIVGLDMFNETLFGKSFVESVREAVIDQQLSLEGPYQPAKDQGIVGPILIVRQAIFSSAADANETFGQPSTPSPGCGEPCGFNATSRTKFWGFVGAIVQLHSPLPVGKSASPPLQALANAKYLYSLTAPLVGVGIGRRNGSEEAGSPAGPPPRNDTRQRGGTFLVESSAVLPGKAQVKAEMDLLNVQWTLTVGPSDGSWMPVWTGGVVAAVVVLSFVAALALFGLLVSRRRKQMLLETLLPSELVKDLQADHAETNLEPRVLDTDSPADLLHDMLGRLLTGEPPDLRDVVLLRTVLWRRMDVYRPLNLGGRIREANLDVDVASALMRQLGDSRDAPSVDGAPIGVGAAWEDDGAAAYGKPDAADNCASPSSSGAVAAGNAAVLTAAARREQHLEAECKTLAGALSYIIFDSDAILPPMSCCSVSSVQHRSRPVAADGCRDMQCEEEQAEEGPEEEEQGEEEEERAFGSALLFEASASAAHAHAGRSSGHPLPSVPSGGGRTGFSGSFAVLRQGCGGTGGAVKNGTEITVGGTAAGRVLLALRQSNFSTGSVKSDVRLSACSGDATEVGCSSPQGSIHASNAKAKHIKPLLHLFNSRRPEKGQQGQPSRHYYHHGLLPYRHESQPGPVAAHNSSGGGVHSNRLRLGSGSGFLLRLLSGGGSAGGGEAGGAAVEESSGSGAAVCAGAGAETGADVTMGGADAAGAGVALGAGASQGTGSGSSVRRGYSPLSGSRSAIGVTAAGSATAAAAAAGSDYGGAGGAACASQRVPAVISTSVSSSLALGHTFSSERRLRNLSSLTSRQRSAAVLPRGYRTGLSGSDPDTGAGGSPVLPPSSATRTATARVSKRSSMTEICSFSCEALGDAGIGGGRTELEDSAAVSAVRTSALVVPSAVPARVASVSPPVLEEVEMLLAQSEGLQYDTWRLQEASGGHALSCMAFYLVSRTGLMERFRMKPLTLARFLRTMEAGYQTNPYHNSTHAADVVRTLHVLVHAARLNCHYLDPLGLLAAYFAAIVHDYGHPGLTNDFLVASSHPLALRYNDRSPLESHHVGAVFSLLAERPELDALAGLSRAERAAFRKQVIEMVLATDMKQHFAILSHFTSVHRLATNGGPAGGVSSGTGTGAVAAPTGPCGQSTAPPSAPQPHTHTQQQLLPTQAPPGPYERASKNRRANVCLSIEPAAAAAAGAATAAATASGGNEGDPAPTSHPPPPPVPLDESERLLGLQVALKVADIGHLGADLGTHKRWLAALEEEFFRQGDRERELGLPISPLFDRAKQGVSKSQVGFFDFVALPLLRAVSNAFPGAKPLLDCYLANYDYWKEVEGSNQQGQEQEQGQGQPPASAHVTAGEPQQPREQPTQHSGAVPPPLSSTLQDT